MTVSLRLEKSILSHGRPTASGPGHQIDRINHVLSVVAPQARDPEVSKLIKGYDTGRSCKNSLKTFLN